MPPSHWKWNVVCRDNMRQRAVDAVSRLVKARNVESALGGEAAQQVCPIRRSAERAFESRNQRLAFSGSDDIGKWCQGFGLTKVTAPPITTSG